MTLEPTAKQRDRITGYVDETRHQEGKIPPEFRCHTWKQMTDLLTKWEMGHTSLSEQEHHSALFSDYTFYRDAVGD